MREGKARVRYMLVSNYTERANQRCGMFDIAFLTEDGRYVEYEVNTRKTQMTPRVQAQYHSIMADYQMTPRTKLYFRNVGKDEPVRMIFKAVAQQLGILMHNLDVDKMVRRLCHIHPCFINKLSRRTGRYAKKREGHGYFLQQVWRKIVAGGLCPWITAAYDEHISSRGYREYKYRKQLVRLGMYYIQQSSVKQSYDAKSKGEPAPALELPEPRGLPKASAGREPEPGFAAGIFS